MRRFLATIDARDITILALRSDITHLKAQIAKLEGSNEHLHEITEKALKSAEMLIMEGNDLAFAAKRVVSDDEVYAP